MSLTPAIPLSLEHQHLLEEKFHAMPMPISEFSFANLYLFREIHRYKLILWEGEPLIQGEMRDKTPFILLTSVPTKQTIEYIQTFISKETCLYPIPEKWITLFQEDSSRMIQKDEDSDYLFSKDKLASYPGRHLSKKRNLVKQLFEDHSVRIEPLTKPLVKDALAVLDHWHQELRNVLNQENDYDSCREGLELIDILNLSGRLLYVDDIPTGFTLGERISTNCYTIHFCKVSPLIKGAYQQLYKDIAAQQDETCEWIDLEQDLGLPSLRQAKHSYLPDIMLKKWRIYF